MNDKSQCQYCGYYHHPWELHGKNGIDFKINLLRKDRLEMPILEITNEEFEKSDLSTKDFVIQKSVKDGL